MKIIGYLVMLISIVFIVYILFFADNLSTPKAFNLTTQEIQELTIKAKEGNNEAIDRLGKYYLMSLDNKEETLSFLKKYYKTREDFEYILLNELLNNKTDQNYKEAISIILEAQNNKTKLIKYVTYFKDMLRQEDLCKMINSNSLDEILEVEKELISKCSH
ncbi:MAG: hypothetical protein LBH45_02980 [Campylobacteraceae bacterium]|nr:hypothetical protein [Campylobacteraceae bacterium]